MNPDEICLCTHTYEVHFGHECSALFCSGEPCPCKEFASIEAGVEIYEALKALLPHLPDRNDALNYAATNDGRASSFQVAAIKLREVYNRTK